MTNSNSKTKTGIPCLGGLPIIGAAFSEEDNTDSNSNIVIFMRPTIINSLEEMKQLTIDQEEYFHNQAPTTDRRHRFDEAMELIKSPND